MTPSGPGFSLARALRKPGQEVQLSEVLREVCQDEDVAREFVIAALKLSGKRGLPRVPRKVFCRDQQQLVAADTGALVGRGDLSFFGRKGWTLLVELKLYSDPEKTQLVRYLATGNLVLVVTSRPDEIDSSLEKWDNWVGVISWEQFEPALKALPVRGRGRGTWMDWLRVMKDDGDFEPYASHQGRRKRDQEMLETVQQDVLEDFKKAIARRYPGVGLRLARTLFNGPAKRQEAYNLESAMRDAQFGIRSTARPSFAVYLSLRDSIFRSPTVRVSWVGRRESIPRSVRNAYDALEESGFTPAESRTWVGRSEPLSSLDYSHDQRQAIRGAFKRQLRLVLNSGVVFADIPKDKT